ncbi:uncharacterized protein METZ01_LOCUS41242 [marine metagenome]|uniref:Uncharacterized protein n=1 Tax=marine metagenome TaxID=408172 RepID=A0A381RBR6_9ZZZZ
MPRDRLADARGNVSPIFERDGGGAKAVNTETAMSSTGDTGNSESMLENRS